MRARICSAISCDVFARVVCLRLRRVAKLSTYSISPVPHALATHYFLRLTRARGRRFLRGCKILLNDFWYFSSLKSTIREKFLYDTSLSEFFSLVRKERKGQKEERFDSRLGDADTHASRMCQFPRRPAMIHKSTFPVLLPWLVFSTLSRTFSPWRKFSLRGQGWRRPFSCASSSFRIARPVYSCECLNPARDNPASAR